MVLIISTNSALCHLISHSSCNIEFKASDYLLGHLIKNTWGGIWASGVEGSPLIIKREHGEMNLSFRRWGFKFRTRRKRFFSVRAVQNHNGVPVLLWKLYECNRNPIYLSGSVGWFPSRLSFGP